MSHWEGAEAASLRWRKTGRALGSGGATAVAAATPGAGGPRRRAAGQGAWATAAVLLSLLAAGSRAGAQAPTPVPAATEQGPGSGAEPAGVVAEVQASDVETAATAPAEAPAAPTTPAAPATPAETPGAPAPAEGVRLRWSGSGEFMFWSRVTGSLRQPIFVENSKNVDLEATHFHPKLTATIGPNALVYAEICLTHPSVGIQPEQAWFEYNLGDRANLQFGRILIPFGQWNQIHDVYDHKSIAYPLMYLGHEESELELQGGPSPIVSTGFTDLGLLFFGSVWPRRTDQLWYGVYLCNGRFGTSDLQWLDLWDHVADNNSNKAIGGRVVYTRGDNWSVGASYQTGKFDPAERLRYTFSGFDLYRRFRNRVNLRAEYVRNPVDSLTQGYTKQGWWAQVDFPLGQKMEFVASASGLRRRPAQRVEDLRRYTLGVNRNLTSSLKLKTELEFLDIGGFVGDPANTSDAQFGTSFDDTTRFRVSLVAVF